MRQGHDAGHFANQVVSGTRTEAFPYQGPPRDVASASGPPPASSVPPASSMYPTYILFPGNGMPPQAMHTQAVYYMPNRAMSSPGIMNPSMPMQGMPFQTMQSMGMPVQAIPHPFVPMQSVPTQPMPSAALNTVQGPSLETYNNGGEPYNSSSVTVNTLGGAGRVAILPAANASTVARAAPASTAPSLCTNANGDNRRREGSRHHKGSRRHDGKRHHGSSHRHGSSRRHESDRDHEHNRGHEDNRGREDNRRHEDTREHEDNRRHVSVALSNDVADASQRSNAGAASCETTIEDEGSKPSGSVRNDVTNDERPNTGATPCGTANDCSPATASSYNNVTEDRRSDPSDSLRDVSNDAVSGHRHPETSLCDSAIGDSAICDAAIRDAAIRDASNGDQGSVTSASSRDDANKEQRTNASSSPRGRANEAQALDTRASFNVAPSSNSEAYSGNDANEAERSSSDDSSRSNSVGAATRIPSPAVPPPSPVAAAAPPPSAPAHASDPASSTSTSTNVVPSRRSRRTLKQKHRFDDEDLSENAVRRRQVEQRSLALDSTVALELVNPALIERLMALTRAHATAKLDEDLALARAELEKAQSQEAEGAQEQANASDVDARTAAEPGREADAAVREVANHAFEADVDSPRISPRTAQPDAASHPVVPLDASADYPVPQEAFLDEDPDRTNPFPPEDVDQDLEGNVQAPKQQPRHSIEVDLRRSGSWNSHASSGQSSTTPRLSSLSASPSSSSPERRDAEDIQPGPLQKRPRLNHNEAQTGRNRALPASQASQATQVASSARSKRALDRELRREKTGANAPLDVEGEAEDDDEEEEEEEGVNANNADANDGDVLDEDEDDAEDDGEDSLASGANDGAARQLKRAPRKSGIVKPPRHLSAFRKMSKDRRKQRLQLLRDAARSRARAAASALNSAQSVASSSSQGPKSQPTSKRAKNASQRSEASSNDKAEARVRRVMKRKKAMEVIEHMHVPKGTQCRVKWSITWKIKDPRTLAWLESWEDDQDSDTGSAAEGGPETNGSSTSTGAPNASQENRSQGVKVSLMGDGVRLCRATNLGLPKQRDFYAVLVQGERAKKEHIYDITSDLKGDLNEVVVEDVVVKGVEGKRVSGVLEWTVPAWLSPGVYKLEIGSRSIHVCSTTEPFRVTEAFGMLDFTTVGVWCLCESVQASEAADKGKVWVSCSTCHSWQHWCCYERPGDEPENSELGIVGHKRSAPIPNNDASFTCWSCFQYQSVPRDKLPVALESEADYAEVLRELESRRLQRMIRMFNKASGGYSRRSFDRFGREIVGKRLYCTPNHAVCFIGTLLDKILNYGIAGLNEFVRTGTIQTTEPRTAAQAPHRCADLGAGVGALSSILPAGSTSVEIDPARFQKGSKRYKTCKWILGDVLEGAVHEPLHRRFDLIIANPDFEVALPFLCAALYMLRDHEDARLLFLLPSDYFEASPLRSRCFKLLPVVVETEFKLGHLNYLEDDPLAQKLTVDSLFVIRRGRLNKFVHTVVNARLGGML